MTLEKERIAKFLSRSGVCSRRDGEKLIQEGRVKVNGTLLDTPAFLVSSSDRIEVDNQPIDSKEDLRVWLYYKPVGLVTSHKDPEGRPTVFEDVKEKGLPRVISVGRLDLNSEGLLLLTNSGAFSHKAEHPQTKWARTYKVRVYGDINEMALLKLKEGITIEGIHYQPIEAVLSRQSSRNGWIMMTLHEGKNREIRKVLNYLGLQVNRLIRISYGLFELGKLTPGDIKEVSSSTLKKLGV